MLHSRFRDDLFAIDEKCLHPFEVRAVQFLDMFPNGRIARAATQQEALFLECTEDRLLVMAFSHVGG